jgi:hypothetical protein
MSAPAEWPQRTLAEIDWYKHRNADLESQLLQALTEVARLGNELAEADALIATHQFEIDRTPPGTWPPDGYLAKAVNRHLARLADPHLAELP